MTQEQTATTATTDHDARWAELEEKAKKAGGLPFYPIGEVPAGEAVIIRIDAIYTDPATFQGKFSILELDVHSNGSPYRLCVSGTRLGGAVAKCRPRPGDVLRLVPIGSPGRERKWDCEKVIPANVKIATLPM